MAERTKMPRENRAVQFAPFDAMKGLREALKMKEYEMERIARGELSEEKAREISNILLNLKKSDVLCITYYEDGHYLTLQGIAKLILEENILKLENKKIPLDTIFDAKILTVNEKS